MKKRASLLLTLLTISLFVSMGFTPSATATTATTAASIPYKWCGWQGWHKYLMSGAYRAEKNGWIFVHLEGTPFQIGYQRGYLLADNINVSGSATIHIYWSEEEFGDSWYIARDIARVYVWPQVPQEQRIEMLGIVAGLKAAGYTNWDLWDIVAFNAWADIDAYWDAYMETLAVGLHSSGDSPLSSYAKGCSAFIATGNATSDGQIVIAHNTWAGYAGDYYWNVIFDVKPQRGHEILYQSTGMCIWSGQDWIMNDAGLMVCETTLPGMDVYNIDGIPIFVRIRNAMQYTDNIDDWLDVMTYNGNGAYSNEWLIGDAKTGEICSLQLGCYVWDIERTFNGFIGSSNYPKGPSVRSETTYNWTDPTTSGYCRNVRWQQLRDEYYGEIDVELAKLMLADHYDVLTGTDAPSRRTICGHGEVSPPSFYPSGAYDGKVTSSNLAYPNLGMWGRWGHPCGTEFIVDDFLEEHPEYEWQLPYLHDLLSNDWTLFNKAGPVHWYPSVMAKGKAFVKLEDGWVRGPATLWIFVTVPGHCDLPINIHLVVGENEFWWVIDEGSIQLYRNIVKLEAEPAHGIGAPAPITVIAYHRCFGDGKLWDKLVVALGHGVHFVGWVC